MQTPANGIRLGQQTLNCICPRVKKDTAQSKASQNACRYALPVGDCHGDAMHLARSINRDCEGHPAVPPPKINLSGPDSGASPCKPSAAHLDSLREDSVRQSATRERNPHDVLSTLPRDEWVRTWRCIVDHCWQKKGCLREH